MEGEEPAFPAPCLFCLFCLSLTLHHTTPTSYICITGGGSGYPMGSTYHHLPYSPYR